MFVRFEVDRDKNISINDYINKPIINNDKAIGIMINAIEKDNKIIVEGEIWNNFIDINTNTVSENDVNSLIGIDIDLKEKPYYLKENYKFMSDEDYKHDINVWRIKGCLK